MNDLIRLIARDNANKLEITRYEVELGVFVEILTRLNSLESPLIMSYEDCKALFLDGLDTASLPGQEVRFLGKTIVCK